MAGELALCHAKKGKRRQNTNRHGYRGEWTEPKLLTIYVVDQHGKRLNNSKIPVTNDGTYAKTQPFLQLLEMHLLRLGINLASQVLLIADGAKWMSATYPAFTATPLLFPLVHTRATRFLPRYRTLTVVC